MSLRASLPSCKYLGSGCDSGMASIVGVDPEDAPSAFLCPITRDVGSRPHPLAFPPPATHPTTTTPPRAHGTFKADHTR